MINVRRGEDFCQSCGRSFTGKTARADTARPGHLKISAGFVHLREKQRQNTLMHPDNPDLRAEYTARINRVIDHIEEHLDQPLSLADLAAVAHFSPYHFHRIFRGITGETLHQFIQRVRIEKAAAQLLYHPKKSITEVALDCGFSGSAPFARAFREAFGMPASTWRRRHRSDRKQDQPDRKISQMVRNERQASEWSVQYLAGTFNHQKWTIMINQALKATVEVKDLPEMTVAYVRHVGPYAGDSQLFERLFNKLLKWAGPRGLLRFPETTMLSVYHDAPEITDASKLRTSICITVPEDTEVDGEIGKMTVGGGRYAVARFELSDDEYSAAWDAVFGGWLPESGYQPADGPSMEIYHNDPHEHPEGKSVVDICVPVKPL